MKILLLCLILFAQTDPWQSYDSNGWGPGGKPKPIVPEHATVVQVGALLAGTLFVLYITKKKKL